MSTKTNCVPVDASEHSNRAFDWYVKNLHGPNDTLVLLHVHQPPPLPSLGFSSWSIAEADRYKEILKDSVNKSQSLISHYEKMCKEYNIKHRVVFDEDNHSPGNRICEVAKKDNIDMIVMGQRGLGIIGRAILGSTSDYVLHHSPSPVIVVPPPNKNQTDELPRHSYLK